jgi:hypothetical protein
MTRKDAMKLFVRFLIIFGFCCPIFVAIGIALGDNANGFWETMIYVVIGGAVFILEEYFFLEKLEKPNDCQKTDNARKIFCRTKENFDAKEKCYKY